MADADDERQGMSLGLAPAWADRWGEDRFGPFASFVYEGVEQRMRWVRPGLLLMGSPEEEEGRFERETLHEVELTRGYWMADTPCTQALWEAATGENPSRFVSPRRPVEQVSWEDAQRFIESLNGWRPELRVELPTEAQWERACRAETQEATYAGAMRIRGRHDAPVLESIAWYGGNSGVDFELEGGFDSSSWPEKAHPHTRAGTRTVGLKRPNAWGLYDMLGNVWEWCADRYAPYPTGRCVDPKGPASGQYRVSRGGSWGDSARYSRAAYRRWGGPGGRDFRLGFRLIRGQGLRQAGERSESKQRSEASKGRQAREGDPTGGRPASSPIIIPGRSRPGWADYAGEDELGRWAGFGVGGATQRLRWIAPGTFRMGSPEDERGRWDNEGPAHEVTLTRGFWMADTPCTQALWEAVTGENPSRFVSPRRPVERVSWQDALAFLQALAAHVPGLVAMLPTEAQWEYACRAGTTTATYAGPMALLGERNAPVLEAIAWYGGNSGVGFELEDGVDSSGWEEKASPHERAGTREVGRQRANAWGLYDMLGNVDEWCADWMGDYSGKALVDPQGPERGRGRVYRGGSWDGDARDVRAAFRYWYPPSERGSGLGFRIVVEE